jgi:uncharacterized protein YutE (UPF0331/DUF86 family)
MNSAQHLEMVLSFLLLYAQHERTPQTTLDDLRDLHSYLFRRPLGNLIKHLKKEVPVPPRLEADLMKALDLRNLLAHRYFKERLVGWFTSFGLREITKELKEIKTTFELVSQEIQRLTQSLFKEARHQKEQIKKTLEQEFLPLLEKGYALDRMGRRMRRHKRNRRARMGKRGGRQR